MQGEKSPWGLSCFSFDEADGSKSLPLAAMTSLAFKRSSSWGLHTGKHSMAISKAQISDRWKAVCRVLKHPLVDLSDHAHWVWQCKFNPEHDQLLLSSSSDATVQLHHLPKLAKAAAKAAPASPSSSSQWQGIEASRAALYDGHDDSVYGKLPQCNLKPK